MDFLSDNAAGVHPAVLAALAQAAPACADAYDADPWSRRLEAIVSDLFGRPARVFPVPTGTAANALALAACVPPWGGVVAHTHAHVERDEAGALGFFGHGASLLLVPGAHGKLAIPELDAALARRRADVHQVQPAALTLTNATEAGTTYAPDEVRALARWGHARGLRVHLDGARLANAIVHHGARPADMVAEVDLLSLGCVKTGGMTAEAVVVFAPDLAATLPVRRKRAGLMPSKGRLMAAQILGLLESGAWLETARRANAGAQALADALPAKRRLHPVEANMVFAHLEAHEKAALRAAGFRFHDWEVDGPAAARFVVRWDQEDSAIEALARRFRALP
ncbi:MAG: beta-eliminating lyase-related protein [Thermaurantiacus sp.]|uniref:threonine aldolase family protein n=1 Tax=Thermaurantiacus sp. TaxID=2820283 RepID=UPI00298EF35F|nr:beta-eliminating lyase-related protein [Thermaurantiacus sp.]MDW8415320.1 beta-eliminating lyase-related protein [Thermaurantiacus sp.]